MSNNNYRAVITPRSLLQIITEAAETDPRVATCRLSDTFAAEQKSDDPVPLLLVEFDRSTIEQKGTLNSIDWRVYVACFVKRRTDGDNLIEGQSESWNILLDLFYRLKGSDVLRDLGISLPKDNATPISLPSSLHRQDYIGWNLELLFRTPLTLSACDIPGGDLPDYGLAYSGSPVVGNQYLTCATLGSCSLIADMLASIAALSGGTGSTTYVQPGTNTYTGGTASRPTVNVIDGPTFVDVNVNTLNAATYIESLMINTAELIATNATFENLNVAIFEVGELTVRKRLYVGDPAEEISGMTFVQGGSNIVTGGTEMRPTISVVSDPTFDSVSAGSGVINGTLNVGTVAAGAIDASFIYSGGTDLASLLTGGSRTMGVRTSTATTITPALSDANGLLIASAATAITVLIPANTTVAFPIGTQIMFEQGSTGQVRFSGATGVTLNSYGNAKNIVGQYATAFVTLTSSNRWVLDGNLTTLNL